MQIDLMRWAKSVRTGNLPQPECWYSLARALMRLTRKRGFLTLGRLNAAWFRNGQKVRLAGGLDFIVPPDPHFFGYAFGHEPHVAQLITELVSEGDVCVDVGANIGYFSLMMAGIAKKRGKIIAYEPDPTNYALLRLNAEQNGDERSAILPVHAAVSEKPGVLRLVRARHSTQHTVEDSNDQTPAAELVPSVVLDEHLPGLLDGRAVKLLKMDIEGHELPALRGLRRLISTGVIRHMVVEVMPASNAGELDELLRPDRNRCLAFVGNTWLPLDTFHDVTHRVDVWVTISEK